MGQPTRLVINADDFGMSATVNAAIVWSMRAGLVSSTTVMANMPGFSEACKLAREVPLAGKIGVHVNLVEGVPLTKPIRRCARFCSEDGAFSGKLLTRAMRLTHPERQAIELEIETQVWACIQAGIQPTHIDSHHHYHTSWPIGSVVIRVAKRNGIHAVRLSGNCRTSLSLLRQLYVRLYNWRLNLAGFARTHFFGGVHDVEPLLPRLRGIVEVMVHPDFNNLGKLVDAESGNELVDFLRNIPRHNLIPYPV